MRRLITAMAIASLVAAAFVALGSASASASSFSVSPWAYACGQTHRSNPATATDPGGSNCPHPDQPGGYCGENGDTPGSASSGFAAGKLTLMKDGAQCDDLSSGATIGGLATLSAASADIVGGNCGGGSPRLNIKASDGFHFASCTESNGHATFDVSAVEGKAIVSIDVIADLPGTVVLSNLAFTGEASPSPTPTPSPSATTSATPSASASASATPTPSTVVLAQTGGGTPAGAAALVVVGFLLVGFAVLYRARKGA